MSLLAKFIVVATFKLIYFSLIKIETFSQTLYFLSFFSVMESNSVFVDVSAKTSKQSSQQLFLPRRYYIMLYRQLRNKNTNGYYPQQTI